MKTWEINARALRAVQYFKAGKNDFRYYLAGVNLNKCGKAIQSSNGHYAVEIEADLKDVPRTMVIDVAGAIPAKAETAKFTEVDKTRGMIEYMTKDRRIGVGAYTVIDGKFPDMAKIRDKFKPAKIANIGFNPEYAATIGKAFRALYPGEYPAVDMAMSWQGSTIRITPLAKQKDLKVVFWLMPVSPGYYSEEAK